MYQSSNGENANGSISGDLCFLFKRDGEPQKMIETSASGRQKSLRESNTAISANLVVRNSALHFAHECQDGAALVALRALKMKCLIANLMH